jgi:N6-adenosine-specific RNA methylase IME4
MNVTGARRHLNDDQRAALAALWKRECARLPGRPRKDHDDVEISGRLPAVEAPALFNVPRRKVDEATYLLNHSPDRLAAVHRGDLKLKEAARETRVEEQIIKVAQTEPVSGEFPVIVVDPPWPQGRLPYPTMSLEEIKALQIPSAPDCILWLWTTSGFLHEAFHVLESWEFEAKAILTWVKDRLGTGMWLRGQTEHCILAVRGKPLVDLRAQGTALFGPVREHSRKPDEFFELVKSLCPASTFLEMFARGQRAGWTCWGAEAF